jgi:transcription antitermination protein NusB
MKKSTDPRHSARLLALQKLFYDDFKDTNNEIETLEVDIKDLLEEDEINKYDKKLYEKLVAGVTEKQDDCDEMIVKFAPQWPINQIKRVDLQILRMALYEGFIEKLTPPKVAIDEAIELGKEFGGNASDKFVNGVLGAVYEKYKANKLLD